VSLSIRWEANQKWGDEGSAASWSVRPHETLALSDPELTLARVYRRNAALACVFMCLAKDLKFIFE